MPPLPFYSLGQSKYKCTRILKVERENLWIKLHIRLIKTKYHFSGAHFDDHFITGGFLHNVTRSDFSHGSGLRNFLLNITDYNTVLRPCNLACWQVTVLDYTGILSWMSLFSLVVKENYFSVASRVPMILEISWYYTSFHWHHQCHYEKLEHVILVITWGGNSYIGSNTVSGLNI